MMAKTRSTRAKDYEILTAEISKATFGITPSEYKKVKGLKRETCVIIWTILNDFYYAWRTINNGDS
jgi:hypothetical protein